MNLSPGASSLSGVKALSISSRTRIRRSAAWWIASVLGHGAFVAGVMVWNPAVVVPHVSTPPQMQLRGPGFAPQSIAVMSISLAETVDNNAPAPVQSKHTKASRIASKPMGQAKRAGIGLSRRARLDEKVPIQAIVGEESDSAERGHTPEQNDTPDNKGTNAPGSPPGRDVATNAHVVPHQYLAATRIAGKTHIEPPPRVRIAMVRERRAQIVANVKMCLTRQGRVKRLRVLQSSGYPSYDQLIVHQMWFWRYRPYSIGGSSMPICTTVTFVYRQHN